MEKTKLAIESLEKTKGVYEVFSESTRKLDSFDDINSYFMKVTSITLGAIFSLLYLISKYYFEKEINDL